MQKLTVLIPCKNEEKNIQRCLESTKWANELFVVDSGSTDKTLEIARSYNARIVEHEYLNSAAQKNWAIPQASNDWVLVVDADERVTDELKIEIQKLLAGRPEHDGYYIWRKNWFFGVPIQHCGWERDKVLRLFLRDRSRYQDKHVHADVIVNGKIGSLTAKLEHHTYRSFDQYLEKFGRYTTWSALDLKRKNKKPTLWNLFAHPIARFFTMYFFRQGFRDGIAGFILCSLAMFSVFMKYAKLWAICKAESGAQGVEVGRTQF